MSAKNNIVRSNKNLKNKLIKAFAIMFCMGVIICCIIGIAITILVIDVIKNRADIDIINLPLNYTTVIYANNKHSETYEIQRLHGIENRIWVDIEDIPSYVGNAAISIEDQRFMHHRGIDIKRTIGAFLNELFHFYGGRQGGSTISQQLIKNITGDNYPNALRKIREIVSALYLEKKHTKEEILGAYMNVVYFGNNTNGIEAAANLYFNKSAKNLTLREAVAIISITKAPVYYDLFKHPKNNEFRSKVVLKKMLDFNFISKEEYNKAITEELKISDKTNLRKSIMQINTYFTDYLIDNVINDLVEKKGFTYRYAEQQIYKGGYRIYSTVDEQIQNTLEQKFADDSTFPHVTGSSDNLQAAMVVMEPNGKVIGIVGGRGKKKQNRILNRATSSKRQPGSAIKPVSVYALAMEKNQIHYSSIMKDTPFNTQEDNASKTSKKVKNIPWPHNAYGYYAGNVLLPFALEKSSNAVAIHLCDQLGPENCFNFLKYKLGIDSLLNNKVKDNKVYSDKHLACMGLGALTDGLTVLELTNAYQIFANGGYFTKPYAYTKVLDSKGNIVLENNIKPTKVISKSTAVVMNKLLQNVVSYGTGTGAKLNNQKVAGKTGTTDTSKDVWFIGMTPWYLAGVWVGYDIPHTMHYQWTNYPPTYIWRNVMGEIHKNLESIKFIDDKKVVVYKYCKKTGLLASSNCTDVDYGSYRTSNIPTMCDGKHVYEEKSENEETTESASAEAQTDSESDD